jgi:hypothetical protein
MPKGTFIDSYKEAIGRSSHTKLASVEEVRQQLLGKFIGKFRNRLELEYGDALDKATLVQRVAMKPLLCDIYHLCNSIEKNVPSKEVKLLLGFAPSNESMLSIQAHTSSQVGQADNSHVTLRAQVQTLT